MGERGKGCQLRGEGGVSVGWTTDKEGNSVSDVLYWCYYITVDFATADSQNGFCAYLYAFPSYMTHLLSYAIPLRDAADAQSVL